MGLIPDVLKQQEQQPLRQMQSHKDVSTRHTCARKKTLLTTSTCDKAHKRQTIKPYGHNILYRTVTNYSTRLWDRFNDAMLKFQDQKEDD